MKIEFRNYARAVSVLKNQGVLAYPTESCFGLGCDPMSSSAVKRLLTMKKRAQSMGVILVASELEQLIPYLDSSAILLLDKPLSAWPGPVTWILPASKNTPDWITGRHSGVAVRISNHPVVRKLCKHFKGAVVSTSANPHGMPAAQNALQTAHYFGPLVDYILPGITGGDSKPSRIMDGKTGNIIRH